jgi:hypothetical protein
VTAQRVLGFAAIAAVVAGVVVAFLTIGSPERARIAALDRVRVEDMYRIASALHDRFTVDGKLPPSLPDDLTPYRYAMPDQNANITRDPVSGKAYSYRVLDPSHYRLCATFARAADIRPRERTGRPWKHPAGSWCFTFDARNAVIEPDEGYQPSSSGPPPF